MKDAALYLEVDEDITSAIDKLQKVTGASVQVVVPKRSTMLQSVINQKLLKKAAGDAGKELVLVTNDRVATDLAARVGLAVAPSLGAKPVLSEAVTKAPDLSDVVIEDDADAPTPPAPEPETAAPEPDKPKKAPKFAHRDVDDQMPVPAAETAGAVEAAKDPATDATESKPKAPKVPNYNRMQRRLKWAGLAALLLVGYFVAMYFFASAKVTLYAAGSKVNVDTNFKVDSAGGSATDTASGILAGQTVTYTKTLTGPVTPTGKQDVGTKAHGSVTIKNCEDNNSYPLAAGNILTSQGLNFTTDAAVTIPPGNFTHGGQTCNSSTVSVSVSAAQNGDNYNLSNASFSSAKLTANFSITGSMSGGTTKSVTVLQQSDVDSAKAALLAQDKSGSQTSLGSKVPSDYQGLSSSIQQTATSVTPSPAVGQEANTANLSVAVSYTELAVKKTDFSDLVKADEQKQVGDQNQIYDDGLGQAQINLTDKDASGRQGFHLSTQAFSGQKLDKTAIAKQLAGQKYGDASDTAGKLPGVQRADISLWPAWSLSLPRASKVTIDIQVANQ